MSHSKERKEKICLNCNTELTGRFCPNCGQENIEPRETFWGLITHFFNDITHFDGKFFSSLKYLVIKPGFLPAEFMKGRRADYLNPIRMYVFTSAVFFLIFYNKYTPEYRFDKNTSFIEMNKEKLDKFKAKAYETASNKQDSLAIDSGFAFLNKVALEDDKDTTKTNYNTTVAGINFKTGTTESKYKSKQEYDSIQLTLPADQKDNWFERQLEYKNIHISSKYGDDNSALWTDVSKKFIHLFPYMLFVSLPLYALFLKLLYVRKKRYYVEHIIFLIYLYIFTFLFLLLYFGVDAMYDKWGFGWIKIIKGILLLAGTYYAYKSMRKFYEQGRFKTFLKFSILNLLAFISLMIIFSVFFGLTIYQL